MIRLKLTALSEMTRQLALASRHVSESLLQAWPTRRWRRTAGGLLRFLDRLFGLQGASAPSPPELPGGWNTLLGLHGHEGPSLQPWALEATRKQRAIEDAAVKPTDGIDAQTAACTYAGMPDFMAFPEPYDIVQRQDEMVIDVERERTLARHIYIEPFHKAAKDYEDVGRPIPMGAPSRIGKAGNW